jgi:hypothetical protein
MVSSPCLLEVRVYLKAAASWMLTSFGGSKPKSAISCIKLHDRDRDDIAPNCELASAYLLGLRDPSLPESTVVARAQQIESLVAVLKDCVTRTSWVSLARLSKSPR